MNNNKQKLILVGVMLILIMVGLNLNRVIVFRGTNNLEPVSPGEPPSFVEQLAENKNKPVQIVRAPTNLNPQTRSLLLPFRLLGIALEARPRESLAVIQNIYTLKQGVYKTDDTISGYRIVRILRGQVDLLKNGKIFVLSFSSAEAGEPVLLISENERVINRNALSKKLPDLNLNTVFKEVLALPHIESGKIKGFKIAKINNKRLGEISGLKDGDILASINGLPLDSLKKPLEIYRELGDEKEIKLEIKRGNDIKTLTYYIN